MPQHNLWTTSGYEFLLCDFFATKRQHKRTANPVRLISGIVINPNMYTSRVRHETPETVQGTTDSPTSTIIE